MSDFVSSLLELARILGPTQTAICLLGVALAIYFWVALYKRMSNNPRHHSDEYVKSHMWEFYSWFQNHPEDRSRYEELPSGVE